jgi:hypothetical protein
VTQRCNGCPYDAQPAVNQPTDEREAFEAAWKTRPACCSIRDEAFWIWEQARAALAQQPGAQDKPLVINGHQLRAALEFVAPDGDADQLEQLVCIQYGPARDHDEGHDDAGLYCWLEECPEEGSIRLDDEPTCAAPGPVAQDREEAEIGAAEATLLAKTLDEFGDCGDTTTDHRTLLRWAFLGLLECTHFVETDKGRAVAVRAAKGADHEKS